MPAGRSGWTRTEEFALTVAGRIRVKAIVSPSGARSLVRMPTVNGRSSVYIEVQCELDRIWGRSLLGAPLAAPAAFDRYVKYPGIDDFRQNLANDDQSLLRFSVRKPLHRLLKTEVVAEPLKVQSFDASVGLF